MKRSKMVTGGAALCVALTGALAAAPRAKADAEDPAARVELGRRLFFDPAIGRQGRIACASCHDPEHGFSDARPRSPDETRDLPRHSQPLVDLAGDGFHWDGEFDTVRDVIDARVLPGDLPAKASAARALARLQTLASQGGAAPDRTAVTSFAARLAGGGTYGSGRLVDAAAASDPAPTSKPGGVPIKIPGRFVDPNGGAAAETIAERIARDGRYDVGFVAAFGDAVVTSDRIGDALESYLASLRSTTSPFDRWLAGDAAALGASAQRGFELFHGKANCSQCHLVEGARAAFTDGKFHDTGVAAATTKTKTKAVPDSGRLASTFAESDRGSFKTPSLRDVARRAPYFHDASAATLADAVRYYDKGGTADAHLDARLHPLGLADGDVADLVAFLESLTSDERPGLARPAPTRAPRISVRVETMDGQPVSGCDVTLRPFGDRLVGTTAMPSPAAAVTDARGVAEFAMPASTHVVVETIGGGVSVKSPALPDWTSSTTFILAPKDQVLMRVRFKDGVADKPAVFLAHPGGVLQPGERAAFEKVRDLGPSESLYVCTPPSRLTERSVCTLAPLDSKDVEGGAYAVDFARGAVNVVDLRAAPRGGDDAGRTEVLKDVAKILKFVGVERAFAGDK